MTDIVDDTVKGEDGGDKKENTIDSKSDQEFIFIHDTCFNVTISSPGKKSFDIQVNYIYKIFLQMQSVELEIYIGKELVFFFILERIFFCSFLHSQFFRLVQWKWFKRFIIF